MGINILRLIICIIFRLEEEEQTRQKLQLERAQLEGKIKNLEDLVASQHNDLAKVQKERKMLDDKLQEIANQRQDEEEKLKNLLRIKTKQESQNNDLEERLKREIEVCVPSNEIFHRINFLFSFVKNLNVKFVDLKVKIKNFVLNYKNEHKILMIYNRN